MLENRQHHFPKPFYLNWARTNRHIIIHQRWHHLLLPHHAHTQTQHPQIPAYHNNNNNHHNVKLSTTVDPRTQALINNSHHHKQHHSTMLLYSKIMLQRTHRRKWNKWNTRWSRVRPFVNRNRPSVVRWRAISRHKLVWTRRHWRPCHTRSCLCPCQFMCPCQCACIRRQCPFPCSYPYQCPFPSLYQRRRRPTIVYIGELGCATLF